MTAPDDLTGDDALAAEYVLGVLSAGDRQLVSRRVARDAVFARLVDAWEVRLAPFGDEYAEQVPSASVKASIDQRLFGLSARPSGLSGLWQSLTFWRGLAGAAVLAGALLLALPMIQQPALSTRLVASLAADGSDVRYLAIYDAVTSHIDLSYVGGMKGQDRDFELWVIAGNNAPVSVGIIPDGQTVRVPLQQTVRQSVQQGAIFAISLEPKGGSPTGQPTGAVVALGQLRNI